MNEIVTINETKNDGKSVHLYFNGLLGLYTAYGYSAFILSKLTAVNAAFSESVQMPVVVLNPEHLDELLKTLEVVKHEKGYYLLAVDGAFDEKEYEQWVEKVRVGGV